MNQYINYIIQFVIGGGIIVGMSLLANHVHPKYAALLYALPIQFTLASIFIYYQTNEQATHELAQHSLWYAIAFVGFLFAFYLLTNYFSFWESMIGSYTIFIVAIILILKFF